MTNLFQSPTGKQWSRIGTSPHHGIGISLAALRSQRNLGVGEFFDLIPLIDWCRKIGLDVIQLLPLGDSGNLAAPYNAVSSCALNPIYLSLHALPDAGILPEATNLPRLAYHDVLNLKLDFLRTYYTKIGPEIVGSSEFQKFLEEQPWVLPYAVFKVQKDLFGQTAWTTWPDTPNYPLLLEKNHDAVMFYATVQYLCYLQLKTVRAYGHEKGVLLKGDIPILISADSVDVWLSPSLFNFKLSAGAPPDPYNLEGQNWGFPILNWEVIRADHYGWWKRRLAFATQLYDIFRLDHVVGFFRIWSIPQGKSAKEGSFIPENPAGWIPQGKEILEMMIEATPMLPIAEDLGTVPPSVRVCLRELGICGTRVVRWERDYEGSGDFIPYQNYPEISMTTVSTHDSETLQQWWKNCPDEAKAFCQFKQWEYSPDLTHAQRLQMLFDAHHTPSIFHINLLQEYLALFPELVWPNPDDERINIPGKVLPTNWTYRFRPSIEEIALHPGLESAFQEILSR